MVTICINTLEMIQIYMRTNTDTCSHVFLSTALKSSRMYRRAPEITPATQIQIMNNTRLNSLKKIKMERDYVTGVIAKEKASNASREG